MFSLPQKDMCARAENTATASVIPQRELILDVARMEFDGNGLRNFFWPLGRAEQQAQRDTTLRELVRTIRPGLERGDEDSRLLGLCIHWLTNEAQMFYRATALIRRCEEAEVSLVWPEEARLYPAVKAKQLPSVEGGRYYLYLRQGPAAHHWLFTGFIKLRRSLHWNGLGVRGLRPARFDKDIIACYRSPLLDLHARRENRTVKQTHLQEWFPPHAGKQLAPGVEGSLADLVITAIQIGYTAGGEQFPDYQAEYFKDFLCIIPGVLRSYYKNAQQASRQLPRILWTGSGGYMFTRMLRNAVREKGGYVVGHEHASGDAHLAYFSAKPFIEYESADDFMTYSCDGAEALRATFDPDLHLRTTPPRILSFEVCRSERNGTSTPRARRSRNSVKTLMYPTTMLLGERMSLDHIVGDCVMVDWSARLIARLCGLGYTLIHKPHPEEAHRSSRRFAEQFGIRQAWERFESVMDQADVFVLDFSRTTIFSIALASSKPLVYIDFGFERWHPAAYELLQRRASVVRGWIDKSNRLQIDWEKLPPAIDEARELTDRQIIDCYYPHMIKSLG